jgi:hypothetical protein
MAVNRIREILWKVRKSDAWWSCDLVHHGQHGFEVQILRNGGLERHRRFPDRDQAIAWADQEKSLEV